MYKKKYHQGCPSERFVLYHLKKGVITIFDKRGSVSGMMCREALKKQIIVHEGDINYVDMSMRTDIVQLENVLFRMTCGQRRTVPLLFVNGAFWCLPRRVVELAHAGKLDEELIHLTTPKTPPPSDLPDADGGVHARILPVMPDSYIRGGIAPSFKSGRCNFDMNTVNLNTDGTTERKDSSRLLYSEETKTYSVRARHSLDAPGPSEHSFLPSLPRHGTAAVRAAICDLSMLPAHVRQGPKILQRHIGRQMSSMVTNKKHKPSEDGSVTSQERKSLAQPDRKPSEAVEPEARKESSLLETLFHDEATQAHRPSRLMQPRSARETMVTVPREMAAVREDV